MVESFYLQLDAENVHENIKSKLSLGKGLKGTARVFLATDPQDNTKQLMVLKLANLRPE